MAGSAPACVGCSRGVGWAVRRRLVRATSGHDLPRPAHVTHQAVADGGDLCQGGGDEGRRPGRDRAGGRRAGLRHPRTRQGGGPPGDGRGQDQIRPGARNHAVARGDLRKTQAGERPRLHAAAGQRRLRRQAVDLQRADRHPRSRRPGRHPGAVLGQLPGHHPVGRGRAGGGRVPGRRRLQADACGAGGSDHAADQVAHAELPVEPERRRLHRRRDRGPGRGADAPPAGLGDERRHLRARSL